MLRVSLIVLAFLPVAALGEKTCDASNPEKCMSEAGTAHAAEGTSLLQAIRTKSRSMGVAEDVEASGEDSQAKESFDELEKHAQGLTERLELLRDDNYHAAEDHRLPHQMEDRVHKALKMLHEAQQKIKSVRGKHTALLQSSAQSDEARGALMHSMTSIRTLGKEVQEILSEVDGQFAEVEAIPAKLLQTGDEVHGKTEVHEEAEDHEEDEDHEKDEDHEEDGEEDEEEGEEDDEEDHDEDDHEEEDDEHDEASEMQKGTGVQHEAEDEEAEDEGKRPRSTRR